MDRIQNTFALLNGIKWFNILFQGVWNTICDPTPSLVFGIESQSHIVIRFIVAILGVLVNIGICYGASVLAKKRQSQRWCRA